MAKRIGRKRFYTYDQEGGFKEAMLGQAMPFSDVEGLDLFIAKDMVNGFGWVVYDGISGARLTMPMASRKAARQAAAIFLSKVNMTDLKTVIGNRIEQWGVSPRWRNRPIPLLGREER